MKTVSVLWVWLAACLGLACAVPAVAAPTAAKPIPLAHSALLAIEGVEADDSLTIRIRRAADGTAITSKDVSLSIDGRNEPLTAQADGSYQLPLKDLRGDGERTLELMVGHDGIREILTGKASFAAPSSATSFVGDHKQMAWWVLNIAVVLIAALALSRRMS